MKTLNTLKMKIRCGLSASESGTVKTLKISRRIIPH